LIEALHCGLPAAVRNDGGHPEIIGQAGETFESEEDVIPSIEKIADNYEFYQNKINMPDIETVTRRYYQFCKMVFENNRSRSKPDIKSILIYGKISLMNKLGKYFLK
jgi:glycosyltransferase involved in cell wall biosynthesis